MKHITIVVPDGQTTLSSVACIAGTYEIFQRAHEYWIKNGERQLYKVVLGGVAERTGLADGLLTVNQQVNVADIHQTHLIIIPSVVDDYRTAVKSNKPLIEWITKQCINGAEIACMCTGAFMLASTGLLDGKSCSTHWSYADEFRSHFPKVNLQVEQLITDENGMYTSGGAYSFLNLAIYLVEKYYDRQTAIYCSKVFQIEMDRQSQSPFIIFSGQKQHGDEVVLQAQTYIESRLDERISVEELSLKFAVSRRNFDRRFIKATGITPIEYALRVKIESAKKAFETTRKNINEVMYEVGYSDLKAFREAFRRITGILPQEYRNKYNKDAIKR